MMGCDINATQATGVNKDPPQARPKLHIDFVSDVACPWCAVGLNALERALANLKDEVEVELHFQPFELNPQMGVEGQDSALHLKHKYGMSDEQLAAARDR